MFRLQILQYQWLVLALITGAALVLVMILSYLALWRQREGAVEERVDHATAQQGAGTWLRSFMPWILTITVVFCFVYAIVRLAMLAVHPPNW